MLCRLAMRLGFPESLRGMTHRQKVLLESSFIQCVCVQSAEVVGFHVERAKCSVASRVSKHELPFYGGHPLGIPLC